MKRVSQLDGVRGIAILLVLVCHLFSLQVVAHPKSILNYCVRATSVTWSGVDLFFVLSGFLIAGILLDHRNSSNYFQVFYLRRICRIFPLYFVLLILFVAASAAGLAGSASYHWLFHRPFPVWSYATFTQNVLMAANDDYGAHWLSVTWSLAVEEQFYIIIPLLVYVLPRKTLVSIFVLAIIAAPILRCAIPGYGAYVNTLCRSDALLSGATLAILVRWHPFVHFVQENRRLILAIFLLMLIGVAVMSFYPLPFGTFKLFWLGGFYSLFILIAYAGLDPRMVAFLRFPPLVWFGQLSYGIYMIHEVVSGLFHGYLRHGEPRMHSLHDALITLSSFCVTLVLATLSYHLFEKPILNFGHRFHYSPCPKK